MPQMPVYVTVTSSSSSPTRAVNLDYGHPSPFNVAVGATFSSTTMTATYGVEYSLDDPLLLSIQGSTRATLWFPDVNLPAGTAAAGTTNYMFPVAAVRFTVTAISSSSVIFSVLQG